MLKAIATAPHRDDLRLAYAEHLRENGDADRALFIETQIALASAENEQDPTVRSWAQQRADRLQAEHPEWIPATITSAGGTAVFERGFVAEVVYPMNAAVKPVPLPFFAEEAPLHVRSEFARRQQAVAASVPTAKKVTFVIKDKAETTRTIQALGANEPALKGVLHVSFVRERGGYQPDARLGIDLMAKHPHLQSVALARTGPATNGPTPTVLERIAAGRPQLRLITSSEQVGYETSREVVTIVSNAHPDPARLIRYLPISIYVTELSLFISHSVRPGDLAKKADNLFEQLTKRDEALTGIETLRVGPPSALTSEKFKAYRFPAVRTLEVLGSEEKSRGMLPDRTLSLLTHPDFASLRKLILSPTSDGELRRNFEAAARKTNPKLIIEWRE